MPQLFTAVYHAKALTNRPAHPSPVAQAFFAEQDRAGSFPFDHADDPSFFCTGHLDLPVTWGVCRTDARNLIKPGDWVAFFSAERNAKTRATRYRAAAFMKVADKVSGRTPPLEFEPYLNRMVYADGEHWTHHEPALMPENWHADWLWRISRGRSAYGSKANAEALGKADEVDATHWIASGRDALNYVVFDRFEGGAFDSPRLVAHHPGGTVQEEWLDEPWARELRSLVFGASATRWLRTGNRGQPHRHTRRQVENLDELMRQAQAVATRT